MPERTIYRLMVERWSVGCVNACNNSVLYYKYKYNFDFKINLNCVTTRRPPRPTILYKNNMKTIVIIILMITKNGQKKNLFRLERRACVTIKRNALTSSYTILYYKVSSYIHTIFNHVKAVCRVHSRVNGVTW